MNPIKYLMFTLNLVGISMLLMIPIFNLWYISMWNDKSIIKEVSELWKLDVVHAVSETEEKK